MDPPDTDRLQTLVVGLDAACRSTFERLRAADAIPTIESLVDAGVDDDLESQVPPWTPSAWPSMYTGVNPGRHGVYGFLRFDGYDWDVVNRSDVRERAVWETLSDHGVTSVVVNVPVTHPPREFDGALVPGYTAPEDPTCHPEGLWSELEEELGGYDLYKPGLDEVDDETRVDGYVDLVEQRGAAFRHLVDEYEPGFGFVQFQQVDTMFHEFPGDHDVVERVYGAVDRELDAILEACEPKVVLLVSDHGMGPLEGHEFRANDFLRDEGYVETAADGQGMPSWAEINRKQLRDGDEDGDLDRSLAERALATAGSLGLTAQRMATVVEALGLEDVVLEVVPADVVRAASERVAFEDSTAYVRDRIECGVRINLEGREPEGTVAPEEYDDVRAELIADLRAVRTPDGKPLFEAVRPREEVYEGPYVEEAPDVVLEPANFDHFLSASLRGEQFDSPTEPWNHKRDGIVVAAGERIDATADLSGAHLFDVAPTVLATFGVPAASRMDGETLPIVEPVGEERHPAFEPAEGPATEPDARAGDDVTDRLNALGYIEGE